MGYQRLFDEEIARVAALACINDGAFGPSSSSYALALSTTTLSVADIPPAIYRVFLEGMDASLVVALSLRSSSATITLPSVGPPPTASSEPVALFPGSVVERVRVFAGLQTLNVRLVSGTATLYLVPVVQG